MNESFVERLRLAMQLKGLRQTDLVERTGISKGAISSYISGRYTPKKYNIYLLSKALDVNEEWLMGYDEPMMPEKNIPELPPFPRLHCETNEENFMISTYRSIPPDLQQRAIIYLNRLSELHKSEQEADLVKSAVKDQI